MSVTGVPVSSPRSSHLGTVPNRDALSRPAEAPKSRAPISGAAKEVMRQIAEAPKRLLVAPPPERPVGAKCDECPLRDKKPVYASPPTNGKAHFIVVGESPGRLEEIRGENFIGPSGRMLDGLLREQRLDRDDAFIVNAAMCRPDDDRPDVKLAAISCCAPRLALELAALEAPAAPLLALGQWAARAILGVKTIQKTRGFIWSAEAIDEKKIAGAEKNLAKLWGANDGNPSAKTRERAAKASRVIHLSRARSSYVGRTVIPTVHPAFILRGAEGWRGVLRVDVKRFARLLRGEIKHFEDDVPFEIAADAAAIKRLVASLGPIVSVDIETIGPDPLADRIICVGIGNTERAVVIYPWSRKLGPALKAALKDLTVVTHYGRQFDGIALNREKAWPKHG